MLPIVQRELQVAARSPKLHAWRLRLGVIVLLISAGIIFSSGGNLGSMRAGSIFQFFCFLGLLFCVFEGIRKTSDSISEEKREGTLGLLFLTDLKGFDVIMGKLVAALVRSFSALLSIVPILAITLLLGGTTAGEFWRMVLVLAGTLLCSLCLCLLASTFTRDRSIGTAFGIMLIFCVWPFPVGAFVSFPARHWVMSASPFYLLNGGSDQYFSRSPGPFWAGFGLLLVVSFLSILISSIAVPRVWQDKPVKKLRARRLGGKMSARMAAKRRIMLDRNPVMWLMFNAASHRNFLAFAWFVAIAAVLAVMLFQLILPRFGIDPGIEIIISAAAIGAAGLAVAASLHTARESSRNLSEARENGALELMLSTPLKVNDILKGQWLAVKATLLPAGVLFAVLLIFATVVTTFASNQPTGTFMFLKSGAEVIIGVITIYWVGMWMALTSKSPARALFKTLAFGFVLPHLVCTPTLVNQLVLLVVAADKVQVHFRRYVADRYLQQDGFSVLPAPIAGVNAPPVLR